MIWQDRLSNDAEQHVAVVALVLIGAGLLSVVVAALLGVPAWLYLGFLVLVFFGCGSGSACVY